MESPEDRLAKAIVELNSFNEWIEEQGWYAMPHHVEADRNARRRAVRVALDDMMSDINVNGLD